MKTEKTHNQKASAGQNAREITIGKSFLSQGPSAKEQLEAMEARLKASAPETRIAEQISNSIHRTKMVAEMDKNRVRREAKLEILRLVATDIGATLAPQGGRTMNRPESQIDHKHEPGAYGVCRRCGQEKYYHKPAAAQPAEARKHSETVADLYRTKSELERVKAERDEVFAMVGKIEPTHQCKNLSQLVSHLICSCGIAEQERDEAIAALKLLVEKWEKCDEQASFEPINNAVVWGKARRAIAKHEGRAK